MTEADLEIIARRYECLGSLARQNGPIPNAEVQAQAAAVGVSDRTLRNYLRAFRKHGLSGLAPKRRSDRGAYHNLSKRMTDVVRGLHLDNPDWSVRHIHETALHMADELAETAPSRWQVRQIVKAIPEAARLLAHGRESEYKNKYRLTFPQYEHGVVYEIDHCRLDILVVDKRKALARTASGEIRPWLTLVLDSRSRYVVAWFIGYDAPNRHTVKALIRKAAISNPGGIPGKIKIDNGKDLVAREVKVLTADLGIDLQVLPPHQPQQKGRVERFFGTLNTRLWSTLPGYVNSNVNLRTPNVTAELTIQDIQKRLEEFLSTYHSETHDSIGLSPLAFWEQNCFAEPVVDRRKLDLLMLSAVERRVTKQGINFENRIYVHENLGAHVGTPATIRVDNMYGAPDEIEVYIGDHHVCTAIALDSARGQQLTRDEKAESIRRQRRELEEISRSAIAVLNETNADIERRKANNQRSLPQAHSGAGSSESIESMPTNTTPPLLEAEPDRKPAKRSQNRPLTLLEMAQQRQEQGDRGD